MPSQIEAINQSGAKVDLSPRFLTSVAIVGSPAAASETIIAQSSPLPAVAALTGVLVEGYAAFVVGTSGTAVRMRVRQTNVAGAVVADSDAVTGGIAAANKVTMSVNGIDTAPTIPGQVYVLTLTVTAGAAASTVAFVCLNLQIV